MYNLQLGRHGHQDRQDNQDTRNKQDRQDNQDTWDTQDRQDNQDTGQTGQTDLTFKLDFPGNLCWAAFAILAMFLLRPRPLIMFLNSGHR